MTTPTNRTSSLFPHALAFAREHLFRPVFAFPALVGALVFWVASDAAGAGVPPSIRVVVAAGGAVFGAYVGLALHDHVRVRATAPVRVSAARPRNFAHEQHAA